jgi:nucleolar MIF4G domain-containing protein 1
MLEILSDVRANRKRPSEDRLAFLKTWLKKTVGQKKVHHDILLKCRWSDLQSPNWRNTLANKAEAVVSQSFKLDPQLEALAAAQHMNTDLRKQIFSILVTSEDYIDALAKLQKVKKSEREVVRVLIACCAQEQVFNEFYVLLATQLCRDKPSYKYSYQFALWDHLKQMEDYSLRKISNLAKLTARLIVAGCVSVSSLKVLDLEAMNTHQSIFLRVVLEHSIST